MLGTVALLGTNAASAKVNLDGDGEKGEIYAKETLRTSAIVTGDKDKVKYYVVKGQGDVLDVEGEIGIGGTDKSTLVVEFTFHDMVLNTALTKGSFTVGGDKSSAVRQGGSKGENTVTFLVPRTTGNLDKKTMAKLVLDDIGVLPSGVGRVTMEAKDNLPAAVPVKKTVPLASVIKVLEQNAVPNDPKTHSERDFMDFGPKVLKASVGTLTVKIATTTVLDARDATKKITMLEDVLNLDESTVTFAGDFSFAKKVTWNGGADRLQRDTDGEVSDKAKTTSVKLSGTTSGSLEIEVDGKTPIPDTGSYTATVTYTGIENVAFPLSAKSSDLGKIMRDGVTVHIPYLTTASGYNQRLVIVNRSSKSAAYSLTFTPENGMTATAGENAKGILEAGKTEVLSLLRDDVVEIVGGSRTAGTLVVVAQEGRIGVATVQVNLSTGATDTVVYK